MRPCRSDMNSTFSGYLLVKLVLDQALFGPGSKPGSRPELMHTRILNKILNEIDDLPKYKLIVLLNFDHNTFPGDIQFFL